MGRGGAERKWRGAEGVEPVGVQVGWVGWQRCNGTVGAHRWVPRSILSVGHGFGPPDARGPSGAGQAGGRGHDFGSWTRPAPRLGQVGPDLGLRIGSLLAGSIPSSGGRGGLGARLEEDARPNRPWVPGLAIASDPQVCPR